MPEEGFWIAIVVFDEIVEGGFEFFTRAVDPAPKLALGQQSELAFSGSLDSVVSLDGPPPSSWRSGVKPAA